MTQVSELINKKKIEYLRNIKTLMAVKFTFSFNFALSILVPFFMIFGKLSFSQFMVLQSYYMIILVVLEAPSGAIADHLSFKYVLFFAGILQAMAILVYLMMPIFWLLFIGETLRALSECFISGTEHAFLYGNLKALD